ncbi:MAG: CHASE domain protein [Candidatus Curtissbacteria bacterium GW2011_GWA1_40_16]|uniref:CHASE domain protein n=1 Tax=Candidatus Curtissbacteria bacterium GW2011_GWA1_40_16 TaxID=1618405 RepID=A0A0G0TUD2_9BACT|nr:MAG: CHASE domain protein [Candidatus Curtissbacteria bacterium GW2011_GWA1_40_16]
MLKLGLNMKLNCFKRFKISPCAFSYLFLFFGIGVSIFLWYLVKNRFEQENLAKFNQQAENITSLINTRMELYISSLYGVQGLFIASNDLTREEFVKYINVVDIFERYPGVSSFVFAKKVTQKERSDYEKKITLELNAKFATPAAFRIYPEATKDEYYPIIYIAPILSERSIAYGFDYTSEPIKKYALEQARDQNRAVATDKLILLSGEKPEFLVAVPVYKNGVPHETVAQRQKNFEGVILGGSRPEELFSKLFKDIKDENHVNFEIFDGSEQNNLSDARLIYNLDNGKYTHDPNYQPKYSIIKTSLITQRPWTIRFISLPNFITDDMTNRLPILVLLAGFDISLLIFIIMYLITQSKDRALKIAKDMVREYKSHDKLHSHTRVEPIEIKKPKPDATIIIK